MTNPPPLVSAAADVLQQEGVIDVPRAGLCPGNFPRVTDAGAGRQPAIVSVMHPLSLSRRIHADRRRDLWRTGCAHNSVDRLYGLNGLVTPRPSPHSRPTVPSSAPPPPASAPGTSPRTPGR